MKKLYFTFLILISLIVISCGGKDDGGGGNVDPPDPINPPTSTTLVSPANNTECLDGENVEFRWNSSQYTDTYTINVKPINTVRNISKHNLNNDHYTTRKRTTIFLVYSIIV